MNTHLLVPMSAQEFDDIPQKVVPRTVRMKDPGLESSKAIEWIFDGYCRKLLYKNQRFEELLHKLAQGLDESEYWVSATRGQRILHALGALDGQVKNGGITQFFWNCPELIFEASDALKALGDSELLELYDKAVHRLMAKHENWIDLRREWVNNASDPKWETFAESYELLDLGWFDDAYFAHCGPSLLKRLVDYVRSHKEEFIALQ